LRDSVGGYVEAGLPNITGNIKGAGAGSYSASGAFTSSTTSSKGWGDSSGNNSFNFSFNASRSSSVYGKSATVQPPATQMYLYFYVGNFEQDAVEQTAGLNAEMFNDLNAHKVVAFQAPTADNGYTWYRKYADGWVEQGGRFSSSVTNSFNTITMPVPMRDTNYSVFSSNLTNYEAGTGSSHAYVMEKAASIYNLTTTTIGVFSQTTGRDFVWQVSGYAA
jgi:hypothetical protein